MSKFKKYNRVAVAEAREVTPREIADGIFALLDTRISVSKADQEEGSPKAGDMIARNPENHEDQWLIAADYFTVNFKGIS